MSAQLSLTVAKQTWAGPPISVAIGPFETCDPCSTVIGRMPDVRRRCVVTSAKAAIEIGKIAKTDMERHRADTPIFKTWVA